MLTTAEVRWFHRGEIPPNVYAWFMGVASQIEKETVRCDYYFAIPEINTLGLKVRQERVEIKRRLSQSGPVALAPGAVGILELWRKWGFDLVDAASQTESLIDSAEWMPVQKSRLIQAYAIESGDTLIAVPRSTILSRGCTVELTQITLHHREWWTLGFEALGEEEPASLLASLKFVAGYVLRLTDGLDLSSSASFGYPHWLQSVCYKGRVKK